MREAWRELMFADEDLQRKKHRDPVAAAERSEAALDKVATRKLKNGSTFQMSTLPNPAQQRAMQLLQEITV